LDGEELSPIPYSLMLEFVKSPRLTAITLLRTLENLGIELDESQSLSISRIVPFGSRFDTFALLTVPTPLIGKSRLALQAGLDPVMKGPWKYLPLKGIYDGICLETIKFLESRQKNITVIHDKLFNNFFDKYLDDEGLLLSAKVLGLGSTNITLIHPLLTVVNNRLNAL
jgi:hypothetical protein